MKKYALILSYLICFFSCENIQLIPITAEELNKQIVNYKGEKVVLVNVWALWCIPCVEEFPMIVDLNNEIKDLEVIFISADFEDQAENVVDFLSNYKIGPRSYLKDQKDEPFIQGLNKNWTGSLPFTIVYAKKSGSVIDSWEGKEPKSRFLNAVNLAIKS